MSICYAPECESKAVNKGLCGKHHMRMKRHGNFESTTRGINSKQNIFIRKAINFKGSECLIWPYARFETGYGMCHYNGTTKTVHSVVCEEVHGQRPEGKLVRHICGEGKRGCVNPNHLVWGTVEENFQDWIDHDRSPRGVKNYFVKLSQVQALEIYRRSNSGEAAVHLADEFSVSRSCIGMIKRGDSWGWLTKSIDNNNPLG